MVLLQKQKHALWPFIRKTRKMHLIRHLRLQEGNCYTWNREKIRPIKLTGASQNDDDDDDEYDYDYDDFG